MRVFLTGATGFIGGEVARRLQARRDEVVALVRDPARFSGPGQVVQGDLGDAEAIRGGMEGCDAVIHAAAVYRVGVHGKSALEMAKANVAGTSRVLRTALELGIAKVVYVSTVAVFGNTGGRVVDGIRRRSASHSRTTTARSARRTPSQWSWRRRVCRSSSSSRAASTGPATPRSSAACCGVFSTARCRR